MKTEFSSTDVERLMPFIGVTDDPSSRWHINGRICLRVVDLPADEGFMPIVALEGRMRLHREDSWIDVIGRGRTLRIEVGPTASVDAVLEWTRRLVDSSSPIWQLAVMLSIGVDVAVDGARVGYFDASYGDRDATMTELARVLGFVQPAEVEKPRSTARPGIALVEVQRIRPKQRPGEDAGDRVFIPSTTEHPGTARRRGAPDRDARPL